MGFKKKRTLFQKIILNVGAFHLLLILLFVLSYRPPKKIDPQPLIVQTVQLKPPAPKKIVQVKSRPHKQIAKAKPIAKKRPIKRAPPPIPKAKEILDRIDKSLAKIETKSAPITAPKKLELQKTKPLFRNVLVGRLQRELILPEVGTVKVKLAVDDQGKISILEFLISESEVNRQYIEDRLAMIELPSPKLYSSKKTEESYILTFTNRDPS